MGTTTPTKVSRSQPKGTHEGVNCAIVDISATATLSAADILEVVKVPTGARISHISVTPNSAVGTAAISIGDGVDPDRFLTSSNLTAETTLYADSGIGYKYDLSDDASVLYDTIDVTVISGSITVGGALRVAVFYTVDEGE